MTEGSPLSTPRSRTSTSSTASSEEAGRRQRLAGNRPSNTILAAALTPSVLGQLIATYQHKVFTQGVIWRVSSFDQWGVELGKVLATHIATKLEAPCAPNLTHDSSTTTLIGAYRRARGRP